MAFLGAALVSFALLLLQVFPGEVSTAVTTPPGCPNCLFQPLLSGHLLGTSKTLKSDEGIKEKCREGRETGPFYGSLQCHSQHWNSAQIFILGTHCHMKSILIITLGVSPSLFSQCSCVGDFGHCEPSASAGRVTI